MFLFVCLYTYLFTCSCIGVCFVLYLFIHVFIPHIYLSFYSLVYFSSMLYRQSSTIFFFVLRRTLKINYNFPRLLFTSTIPNARIQDFYFFYFFLTFLITRLATFLYLALYHLIRSYLHPSFLISATDINVLYSHHSTLTRTLCALELFLLFLNLRLFC